MGLTSRRQEHRTTTDPLGRRTAYQTASETQTDWPGHQKKRAATNKVDFKAAIKDGWSRSQEASLEKRHRCVQLPYFREAPSEVPLSTSPEPTISIQPASDLVSHTYLSPSLSPGEVRIRPPTSLLTALERQSRTCQQSNMARVLHLPASHVGGGWEGTIRRYRRNPLWANKRRSSDIFSIVSTSPPVPAFGSVKCVACRCSVLSKQLACLTVPTPSMHSRCDITGCEPLLPSPKDGPSLSPSFPSLSQLAAGSRIAAIPSYYFVW